MTWQHPGAVLVAALIAFAGCQTAPTSAPDAAQQPPKPPPGIPPPDRY